MAATLLDITEFPLEAIEGYAHRLRVTARNVDGTVDAAYAGLVNFVSSDPFVIGVPISPTVGVALTSGTGIFYAAMGTIGAQTLTAQDGVRISGTARVTVHLAPVGYGYDDRGLLPYGDPVSSIGASIRKASAITTREVDVTVSNLVQDNSPFLDGDALNPATWVVQRLDTTDFLHVVNVTQVGELTYRLLCLEEFGSVTVTHRASSTLLKDVAGNLILAPHNADFLGLLDENRTSSSKALATSSKSVQDLANPQFPSDNWFAGTLQLNAAGDYRLESGKELVRKLILRRLITTPGDFFHMPFYGIGLKVKEPVPLANLGSLKTKIEQQCLEEREIEQVKATVTMASNGTLTVIIRATLKPTGETLEIGFKSNSQGLVL